MILDSKGNLNYKLAEGTPDERSQPMLGSIALGSEYDRTFEALKFHHAQHTEKAGGVKKGGHLRHPIPCTIQAVWLLWCYAAFDFRRQGARLEAAEARIKALEAKLERLSSEDRDSSDGDA